MRRTASACVVSLAVLALGASSASAALQKLEMQRVGLNHFENSSPHVFINFVTEGSVGLIDEEAGAPRLRKLLITGRNQSTVHVPPLSGFIWFSQNGKEGPEGVFTGTGDTATQIAWGVVTGWSITGQTFCHADPSFICELAVASELSTIQPPLRSTHYDIGTWVFHGTGFTAAPFVYFTVTLPGNQQIVLRGVHAQDGTVPAVSVLALVALGAAVVAREFARRRA